MPFKLKGHTHIVIKIADVERFMSKKEMADFYALLNELDKRRLKAGKKINNHYVVNLDEPYAGKVLDVIRQGEIAKEDPDAKG